MHKNHATSYRRRIIGNAEGKTGLSGGCGITANSKLNKSAAFFGGSSLANSGRKANQLINKQVNLGSPAATISGVSNAGGAYIVGGGTSANSCNEGVLEHLISRQVSLGTPETAAGGVFNTSDMFSSYGRNKSKSFTYQTQSSQVICSSALTILPVAIMSDGKRKLSAAGTPGQGHKKVRGENGARPATTTEVIMVGSVKVTKAIEPPGQGGPGSKPKKYNDDLNDEFRIRILKGKDGETAFKDEESYRPF
jgi:hypothetical protein